VRLYRARYWFGLLRRTQLLVLLIERLHQRLESSVEFGDRKRVRRKFTVAVDVLGGGFAEWVHRPQD
jgi:hypothetical protein